MGYVRWKHCVCVLKKWSSTWTWYDRRQALKHIPPHKCVSLLLLPYCFYHSCYHAHTGWVSTPLLPPYVERNYTSDLWSKHAVGNLTRTMTGELITRHRYRSLYCNYDNKLAGLMELPRWSCLFGYSVNWSFSLCVLIHTCKPIVQLVGHLSSWNCSYLPPF